MKLENYPSPNNLLYVIAAVLFDNVSAKPNIGGNEELRRRSLGRLMSF